MTCIIALKDNDNIWFGADRQHTKGSTKLRDKTPKITRKGDFTIAGAGSARGLQLLLYGIDFADLIMDRDEKEIVITIANELQEINKSRGHYELDEGTERGETYFLIAINKRLFCIEFNYFVHEITDFMVLGGCAEYTEGILEYINKYDNELDVEEKLLRALELTEQFDTTVSGPFDIIEVD
jgi:ATP-dependent protease HslVU (ClpYQ) peptidase subunit